MSIALIFVKFVGSFIWTIIFNIIVFPFKMISGAIKGFMNHNKMIGLLQTASCLAGLSMYSALIIVLATNMRMDLLMELGGTIVTLNEEGYMEFDGNPEVSSSGVGVGTFENGGYDITIDLSSVPDKVALPTSVYQNGTTLARAQMILIINEICSRAEINVTPRELLGHFYVETNGNTSMISNLVTQTFPREFNGSSAGGPFQHINGAWQNSTMEEIKGRAFISTVEDPTLTNPQRVKTTEESSGLVGPTGYARPDMFYFSDAAYSTAVRITAYKEGIYNGRPDASTFDTHKWIDSTITDTSLNNLLHFVLASERISAFNGYTHSRGQGFRTNCCRTWGVTLYADMYLQHGDPGQYSDLSTNRKSMISIMTGDPYSSGGGLVKSTQIVTSTNEASNAPQNSYHKHWVDTTNVHDPSHYYTFATLNGGQWILDGLLQLANKVGTVTEIGSSQELGQDNIVRPPGTKVNSFGLISPFPQEHDITVTSPYAQDRGSYSHKGTDFRSPDGNPLYAMADGKVTIARWDSAAQGGKYDRGGGKMVWINFNNGMEARYMHLQDILCKDGQIVKQGDLIGRSGQTGSPNQPHLHLEVLKGGKHMNPESMFNRKTGKSGSYPVYEW